MLSVPIRITDFASWGFISHTLVSCHYQNSYIRGTCLEVDNLHNNFAVLFYFRRQKHHFRLFILDMEFKCGRQRNQVLDY